MQCQSFNLIGKVC